MEIIGNVCIWFEIKSPIYSKRYVLDKTTSILMYD